MVYTEAFKSAREPSGYWWLNATPKHWRFSDIGLGEECAFPLYGSRGHKRRIFRHFLSAKTGDMVICYASSPIRQVVSVARISHAADEENLYFEKAEDLSHPIDYFDLKNCPELAHMEFFIQPKGSLFQLTKAEYNFIMKKIRASNPAPSVNASITPYRKEDFLREVYMDETQFRKLTTLLRRKQNLILQGAPGVGKTFTAKRLAYAMMGEKDDSRIRLIQFHQNYAYEDFIMGYRPNEDTFHLTPGIFYQFCQQAAAHPEKEHFFMIDEINRGNLSKIFGELLMLIEPEYRGTDVTLAYSGKPFCVPKNIYIIGMMNTADRSLAMIDYALRRRFSFFEMTPGFQSQGFRTYQESLGSKTMNALIEKIQILNAEIASDDSLGTGCCIGHSYFCGQEQSTDEWLEQVVDYDILPMLQEYWFDDKPRLLRWDCALHEVFHDNR
ncbi:MAG: EVE domain-containing protein [Ruminococcaceae bacterium]|nr:EVE domain-containing protein [Oscillospiraceae bacterium]